MHLSSHDASFLYTETASSPMHGISLTVLDGPAKYEEILAYNAARIHLIPRLRQKIAFVPFNIAHPKWVDDPDFRIENHVRRHKVPAATTLLRAEEIALELGEPLLDRSRPLWLTYVIENVEGKTLLAQLSHHAFVDGATAVAISTVLTDMAPDAPAPTPPAEPWNPAPVPTPEQLWQEAMQERAAQRPLWQPPAFNPGQVSANIPAFMARMNLPVMQAPWNAGLVGPKRSFATCECTLDDIKAIRRGLGGTANDVAVTTVMEGVARYLADLGELTENRHLRLMCPVNVRDPGEDPLDMKGNRVSAMFPRLSAQVLGVEARMAEVKAELGRIKADNEPQLLDSLQQSAPDLPPMAMVATQFVGTQVDPTLTAARWPLPVAPHFGPRPSLQGGFNFTLTNVAGPTWVQYVAGHKVLSATGTLMLGGNLGLGVGVVSYAGTFTFAFTADPRLVPQVNRLRDLVAESFKALGSAAAAKR